MELQLVSEEVAILAKELGFDWDCWRVLAKDDTLKGGYVYYRLLYYDSDGFTSNSRLDAINSLAIEDVVCTLPEKELLAKWLRDTHSIFVYPVRVNKGWEYYIDTIQSEGWYNSYEKALEAGLLYTLTKMSNNT